MLTIYRVSSLEALGPELLAFLVRAMPILYRSLRAEIAEEAMIKLVDFSPVRTGKYRASHTPAAGAIQARVLPNMPAYHVPGIPDVDAALQSAGDDQPVFIANAAADARRPNSSYAGLLEDGRRQYSRRRNRTTMWVGSTAAEGGIYRPTVQALLAMRATIEANAIRRAGAQL